MLTLEKLANEMRPHHNEICIMFDSQLVRLIGVSQDDHDLYYIVQPDKSRWDDTKIVHASAVGHIQPLRGAIPLDAYERMDKIFELKGRAPVEHFLVKDERIWDPDRTTRDRYISKCDRFLLTFDRQRPDDRFALWRSYPDEAGREDALILNGEFAKLEKFAQEMIAELKEWADERARA